MAVYVEALLGELAREGAPLRAAWGPPRTVYLGGGTPTALPPALMERLLAGLREFLAAAPDALEFTCECNPGTVDAAYLSLLRAGGVNRLSLGVQTFDDALLRRTGRTHTAPAASAAVKIKRFRARRQVAPVGGRQSK